jgi:Flp pilus assembly protein TadB
MELRAPIIQACNEITEDMCCQVVNNITVCVEVARHNGGHIEHLIHRG